MNWLFKWLGKKIETANRPILESWGSQLTVKQHYSERKLSDGMAFTIHRASGGMVVEHSYYDEKADRNHQSIHIITDDQDLGEQLSKIVTIEMLRK